MNGQLLLDRWVPTDGYALQEVQPFTRALVTDSANASIQLALHLDAPLPPHELWVGVKVCQYRRRAGTAGSTCLYSQASGGALVSVLYE